MSLLDGDCLTTPRCCNWLSSKSHGQSYVTTEGQSASLSSVMHTFGVEDYIFITSDSWGFVDLGRPLCREDVSVVYNCCWVSPAQPFSGTGRAGLMTILYCLRFETPPTWKARFPYLYPPGTGWPIYTPQALGSIFAASYDSQDCGGGIRNSLHAGNLVAPTTHAIQPRHVLRRKHRSQHFFCCCCCYCHCLAMDPLLIERLPRNGQCLSSHVTISLTDTISTLKGLCSL
jgi:hypothetical protein